MSNQYVRDLQALVSKPYHEAKEIGDQWRTPDWLYAALNELYGPFVLDLFTDGQNSKCENFFTADDNALIQDWKGVLPDGTKYFANPPYSIKRAAKGRKAQHLTGMKHIMEKAHVEHQKGAAGCWLVKSATSESWWPDELCTRIIHIKGRIGFDTPVWYRPDIDQNDTSTAGFGASVVLFDGMSTKRYPEEYITREKLMDIGMPLAQQTEADRQRWISLWDEL